MWRLLLGTMGVKSLAQGLNAAATAGFEPRTIWSEVRRRNRLATACYASVRSWNMRMLFSAEKSEHVEIVPTTQNSDPSDVFMHGSHIPTVMTPKDLGGQITSRPSWQDHTDHVYKSCARNFHNHLGCLVTRLKTSWICLLAINPNKKFARVNPADCERNLFCDQPNEAGLLAELETPEFLNCPLDLDENFSVHHITGWQHLKNSENGVWIGLR